MAKRTGYQSQNDSDAYYKRLEQQGVQQNNPPGTAYLVGSNNLGYGVVAAYDANNNFIGFVRGNLGDGVRVNYNPDGSAAGIQMPGQAAPEAPAPQAPAPEPPKFSFNPDAPDLQAERNARTAAFNTMLANITAGEGNLGSDYGFNFQRYDADQRDAQGTLIARAGDVNQSTLSTLSDYDSQSGLSASNPFSRASLLNQSYVRSNRIGEGSYANRGLLTSGAYGKALGRTAENRSKNFNALQKEFAARLNEYRNQRQTGYTGYESDILGINRAGFDRQQNAFLQSNPS